MNAAFPRNSVNRFVPILLAAVLALSGCDDDLFSSNQEVAREPFSFAVEVTTQTILRLDTKNGNITVAGVTDSDSVIIEGMREVGSETLEDAEAHLDNLQVDIGVLENEIVVRTIQPSQADGRNYVVNYEIKVPRDLVVLIDNANGNITVQAMDNNVLVDNANGNITLADISGSVFVGVANGQVDCEVTLPANDAIDITTGNGNIVLLIPASTSADFSANVGNGNITVSNLVLQDMTSTSRSVTGRLGAGEGQIVLVTGNGNITAVGF